MTADPGDCDIIDVTTTAQGHLDWVCDLVAARCPEVSEDEVADAYSPPEFDADPGADLDRDRRADDRRAFGARGAFGPD
jgi:hypothetical protein